MALPPKLARLTGSKWTAVRETLGWRQFHVISVSRVEGGFQVELAATCEDTKRVRVKSTELFDPALWKAGWTPLSVLEREREEAGVAAVMVSGAGES